RLHRCVSFPRPGRRIQPPGHSERCLKYSLGSESVRQNALTAALRADPLPRCPTPGDLSAVGGGLMSNPSACVAKPAYWPLESYLQRLKRVYRRSVYWIIILANAPQSGVPKRYILHV